VYDSVQNLYAVQSILAAALGIAFVDEFDAQAGPLGAKGIGELSVTGVAAAVANAVFDATGIRVREPPSPPGKLLGARYDGAFRRSARKSGRRGHDGLVTGGWQAARATKSWMSRLRRAASQARLTWLGEMSLRWTRRCWDISAAISRALP